MLCDCNDDVIDIVALLVDCVMVVNKLCNTDVEVGVTDEIL